MSDEDMKTQTLIKYGNIYAQVYSDQETNKILAVRFIDADTLTALQPYKINKQENSSSNDQASIPYEQNLIS